MSSSLISALRSIWAAVHSPSGLPFPQTVAQLQALGITRYRVDYIARTITAYTSSSNSTSTPLSDTAPFPTGHSYNLGKPWSKESIVAAIRKAQAGEGNYIEFSGRIVESGVTDYTAYLEGQKVVYCGALGEMHVEWFPGAKPENE